MGLGNCIGEKIKFDMKGNFSKESSMVKEFFSMVINLLSGFQTKVMNQMPILSECRGITGSNMKAIL